METARAKAEQSKEVACRAHTDAAIARQKAAEFEHIQLRLGTIHSQYSISDEKFAYFDVFNLFHINWPTCHLVNAPTCQHKSKLIT